MDQFAASKAVELRDLTSFSIGGRPCFYARPATYAQLRAALKRYRSASLPVRVLGGGSNLLVDDGSLPFAVVHICEPAFDWIRLAGPCAVRVGAGLPVGRLLGELRRRGLGGLEFMTGIPGTVGGALAGNAGAWGHSIGNRVVRLWTIDRHGNARRRTARELAFAYRSCELADEIVTEAEFRLEMRRPVEIAWRMRRGRKQKALRHPMGRRSAGCVFKNPPGLWAAGRLLDTCGLKGARVGGAEVSPVHANFVCNVAGATAADVMELIDRMRREVLARYGVELEMEVERWSSRPMET